MSALRAWLARGSVVATACVVVIAALAADEFLRGRETTGGRGSAALAARRQVERRIDERSFRISPPRPGRDRVSVLADGTDATLVELTRSAGGLAVRPLRQLGAGALRDTVVVPGPARPSAAVLGSFGGPHRLVLLTHRAVAGGRLALAVTDLAAPARPFLSATIARPSEREGVRRELFLGRWTGAAADLFVLDRGSGKPARLRIFSGESGFEEMLLDQAIPFGFGFQPDRWAAALGTAAGLVQPQLLFVTRAPVTGTGRTELHLLSGILRYTRFVAQQPTTQLAPVGATRTPLLGLSHGQPVVLSLDPRSGLVDVLRLPG